MAITEWDDYLIHQIPDTIDAVESPTGWDSDAGVCAADQGVANRDSLDNYQTLC